MVPARALLLARRRVAVARRVVDPSAGERWAAAVRRRRVCKSNLGWKMRIGDSETAYLRGASRGFYLPEDSTTAARFTKKIALRVFIDPLLKQSLQKHTHYVSTVVPCGDCRTDTNSYDVQFAADL